MPHENRAATGLHNRHSDALGSLLLVRLTSSVESQLRTLSSRSCNPQACGGAGGDGPEDWPRSVIGPVLAGA